MPPRPDLRLHTFVDENKARGLLDALLWVPDAVVWAWAKGGEWREQVREYCEIQAV
jgi:hypothetical protein